MTLADTSIWIDHFRRGNPALGQLLADGLVAIHPFVLGEIACGNLKNRAATLADLRRLPLAPLAAEREVFHLIETRRLWGTGLGWVDLHLLASALIAKWDLLTLDRALESAATALGIASSR